MANGVLASAIRQVFMTWHVILALLSFVRKAAKTFVPSVKMPLRPSVESPCSVSKTSTPEAWITKKLAEISKRTVDLGQFF